MSKTKARDFIEHYGIKGMKWGKRRTDAELARARGDKKGDKKGDAPKAVVGKTKTSGKKASEMSDANLKKVLNRMNMEQQYNKLTAPPPSIAKKTTKFFGEIATSIARTQLTALGNQHANKLVGDFMSQKGAAKIPKPPNRFPWSARHDEWL